MHVHEHVLYSACALRRDTVHVQYMNMYYTYGPSVREGALVLPKLHAAALGLAILDHDPLSFSICLRGSWKACVPSVWEGTLEVLKLHAAAQGTEIYNPSHESSVCVCVCR